MYIKKILVAIAILGLVAVGGFSYYIYQSIFGENTAFSSEEKVVLIPTSATYPAVIDSLRPLIKDLNSFNIVAEKKQYPNNIKAGRFILKKGMNNNEIINTLRSRNAPINVTFNNQERIEDLAGRVSTQIEADSLSLLEAMKSENFLAENDFLWRKVR